MVNLVVVVVVVGEVVVVVVVAVSYNPLTMPTKNREFLYVVVVTS